MLRLLSSFLRRRRVHRRPSAGYPAHRRSSPLGTILRRILR